ncbi:MAG: phosphotransferase [Burkholderiales bacterium]|nr:phosphotransferase [Burkholderiales bacterium]
MDRLTEIETWLRTCLPDVAAKLEPASADASFRRYFRVRDGDRSWIVMDAPPEHEDCRPFVHVAGLMAEAGLHAPRVLAQDLDRGLLLLTDLGNTTYLTALREPGVDPIPLFDAASSALVQWQRSSREGVLPPYDEALLRRELMLFPEWYLGRHLGIVLDARQTEVVQHAFAAILENNLAQPRVFVHRDFMPRNLMVSDPNPGILDFQDAVFGPISYDVASLYRDAFLSWDETVVLDGTIRYWEKARKAGLPVHADFGLFWRDVEWMGLQRHLKVLGIFARLHYRDGKSGYLEDTPRFLAYVRATATRYRQLGPFGVILDSLDARAPTAGYTF